MAVEIYAVPEPGTLSLMGLSMGGALCARRKCRSKTRAYEFEQLPTYVRPFLEEEIEFPLVDRLS